ncbi:hypothetical protein SGMN_20590 [Stenotrophomonas geniculata]
MIHGWLEKPSYILLAGMVKQKRAFAYHLMHVKGISFKPEFFIYAATNDVEGVRAKVSQPVHVGCTPTRQRLPYGDPTFNRCHAREPADAAISSVSHAA